MNRNTGAYFSDVPTMNIKRSVLPFKFTHKTTFNTGDLVPIFTQEVLPGDTFTIDTSCVVRLSTSLHPTMDNLFLDTYFYFVPNRLVWDNWTKFMGENDNAWAQDTDSFTPPFMYIGGGTNGRTIYPGSAMSYLGMPPADSNNQDEPATILDFNCYLKIFNDWFRDENLQDEVPIFKSDGQITTAYVNSYIGYFANNFGITLTDIAAPNSTLKAAKTHDYFSSCMPKPQKGPDVLIPASGTVDLIDDWYSGEAGENPFFAGHRGSTYYTGSTDYKGSYSAGIFNDGIRQDGDYEEIQGYNNGNTYTLAYDPNGSLGFDGLQITVNNLRLAMQTQKLLEKDARGGTRYIELIKSHFNVDSPDARLQRSEYLGGKRIPINMAEVIQTAPATGSAVGDLGGRSLTASNADSFTKSFTEHGYIIGLAVVRNNHIYSQGLPRRYSRFNRLNYYFPVLANIGEQPVYSKEIFLPKKSTAYDTKSVFGYQEAWAEYRYTPDRLSGAFLPGTGSLISWTYADNYSSMPTLSSTWLKQGVSEVDRTLVYQSNTAPQFIADFYFHGKAVRPMPVYSIPGLVDHH